MCHSLEFTFKKINNATELRKMFHYYTLCRSNTNSKPYYYLITLVEINYQNQM